ncbi:MAG: glycosyltransferase family 2 protein [Rhodopirellula sp.]|nr:glycosyltransferase family 2 protein [Rhodopirellula sp.]
MSSTTTPPLTVSIVTFNSRSVIRSCLELIPSIFNVKVFDNASTDGTAQLIRENFPNVELTISSVNVGYGRGHNGNLESSRTAFTLILNPDCFLEEGSVQAMLDAFALYPNVAMTGPACLSDEVDEYDRLTDRTEMEPDRTTMLCGHCIMLRMSVFERIGFFDPNLFLFYEDTDLCRRTTLAGYDLLQLPAAKVRHLRGQSTEPSWKVTLRRDFHFGRSEAYFRRKHGSIKGRSIASLYVTGRHSWKAFLRLLRLSPKTIESLCRVGGAVSDAVNGSRPSAR